jgi:hypothetical protein
MSFRRPTPGRRLSLHMEVRAGFPGPILTAPLKCPEDGATTKEEEQVT